MFYYPDSIPSLAPRTNGQKAHQPTIKNAPDQNEKAQKAIDRRDVKITLDLSCDYPSHGLEQNSLQQHNEKYDATIPKESIDRTSRSTGRNIVF